LTNTTTNERVPPLFLKPNLGALWRHLLELNCLHKEVKNCNNALYVWVKKWGENGTFCLTCFRNFVIVLLINLFQTENFAFWGAHNWKFNFVKFYDRWL